MRKKIIGIFIVMLMISSATTMILFSDTVKVEASGGEPQGSGTNLDYDYVWLMVNKFANVIHDVNWSENGGNGIPKGRAWATAGENYTQDNILWPNMGIANNPCGLANYTNLTIGYIPGSNDLEPGTNKPKQYSSKIIVKDFNLTISNNSILYRYIPYSEMYPIPVGAEANHYPLTHRYNITQAKVVDTPLLDWVYIPDHCNVSADVLNDQGPVAGKVVFLDDNESIPIYQSSYVFILNETPPVEPKIENITQGCVILLQNQTKTYTYQGGENLSIPIVKINESNYNLTKVKEEVNSGSTLNLEP